MSRSRRGSFSWGRSSLMKNILKKLCACEESAEFVYNTLSP